MRGPCGDLQVIDLSSGPVGGIATMVLADFGADVIKVEQPGGDPMRRLAAAPLWLRGKRSAVIDLREAEGIDQLHSLVRGADVVVASFAPAHAEPLGADYATLSAINPALVYCSITGWGPTGPYATYPAYEGVVAAKIGRMQYFAGQPRREGPAFSAVPVTSHGASQSAISGILAALMARERDGLGQLVETSLVQGAFGSDLMGMIRTQLSERFPAQFANDPFASYGMPTLQYQPVVTKDQRWIQLANLLEHHFHAFIASIDLSEIYADERFMAAPAGLSLEAREELRNKILERIRERTADEWMERWLADANVGAELFATAQQGLQHPDLVANGEIGEHEHPRLGTVRQIGLLAQLEQTPGSIGGPAPEIGQHTDEVLTSEKRTPRVAGATQAARLVTDARPPLAGVTIVEFATIIATPLGITALADLGARVIKIEPLEGDPYRGMGQGYGAYIGIAKTSAGKESICIDLKTEAGRDVARRILKDADMVVHNFRPGVSERLGIGYEQVRSFNPEVVYLHCTGYGTRGPNAHSVAAHPIAGAAAGGALYQAGRAMPPALSRSLDEIREVSRWLFRANEGNPDPNAAMAVGAVGALALYARRRTGKGQEVRMSMLAANAYANADDFLSYAGKPDRALVDPDLYGLAATYRLYPAAKGWVFLAVVTDNEWAAFCAATGRAELAADPLFASPTARRENDAVLADALAALFATQDAEVWEQQLAPLGVGCVRADGETPGTFFAHSDQMSANDFAPEATHAMWGTYRRWGPAVTLHRTPGRYGPGVLAGEQTDVLLAEFGFSTNEIAQLHADHVVASETIPVLGTAERPELA